VRSVAIVPGFDESCGVSVLQYRYAAGVDEMGLFAC